MKLQIHHLSWHISALFYRHSYIQLAHQVDEELFAYLEGGIPNATIADCGCGPGVVTEKFLLRGARKVFAIDGNEQMLRQVQDRLQPEALDGRVTPVLSRFSPGLFTGVLPAAGLDGTGLDIILFKRSLYMPADQAVPVLQAALARLEPGGRLIVIHPERDFSRYVFGPEQKFQPYTPYHFFNRSVSRLGEWLHLGRYTVYTGTELLALAEKAAGGRSVELIPSRQTAYNLVAIRG